MRFCHGPIMRLIWFSLHLTPTLFTSLTVSFLPLLPLWAIVFCAALTTWRFICWQRLQAKTKEGLKWAGSRGKGEWRRQLLAESLFLSHSVSLFLSLSSSTCRLPFYQNESVAFHLLPLPLLLLLLLQPTHLQLAAKIFYLLEECISVCLCVSLLHC